MSETLVIIIDPDSHGRAALVEALGKEGLADFCKVMPPDELAKIEAKAQAVLWIGEAQTNPPDHIDIRENDFFQKPVKIGAVLDRITRYKNQKNLQTDLPILKLGPYELHAADNFLKKNSGDEILRLTEKETHILQLLACADGGVVTRQNLMDEVWNYADGVETHTLETHIYRLRQKIEEDPSKPQLLLTDEAGYRIAL